jgi:signal transduction histidine kinase/DNA-binding NarL/FixJ family response regulator
MADNDDLLDIVDDDGAEPVQELDPQRWKVAIIDDDPAVHSGTRFALYDYRLNGQGIELLSAYSAAEGRVLLADNPDIAVILLDVVMEHDSAGLELVDHIRNAMRNETVRIILRTGQPGQAPERSVIVDYDINDYKAKTELTSDKLFTALTAAIRSYNQLERMLETRRGLEIIVEAASTLFDFKSMQRLAEGVLTQIGSLLKADCAGILVLRDGGSPQKGYAVLAGSGVYAELITGDSSALAPELKGMVELAFQRRRNEFQARRSVLYVHTQSGREVVVLVEVGKNLTDTDRALIEVFCSRLSVAFDNVILYEQLQDANRRLEARVAERTEALTAANRRLQVNWASLKRVNAHKNELLGKVAHDLKNPLGVILGRTEILTEVADALPAARAQIASQVTPIREAAARLLDMVETLIADAMADADDITVRREPVDLAALVRDTVEQNRPLADRKNQTVTLDLPPSLVAQADPDRLREAVDNLVSNAIKYAPPGGTITVFAGERGGEAAIAVSDDGPGLSPEDRSRLFGRFQRLSAKPTGGESSTGLGLSIAKRIVDLHGGSIRAESEGAGRGTTFHITLPATARN